ncbi:integrase [Streptomyces sp. NPDC002209]
MARTGRGTARAALIHQHSSADRDRLIADALREGEGHAGGTQG